MQLNEGLYAVLTIVLIALLVIVAIYLFAAISTTNVNTTGTVKGETITAVTEEGKAVTNSSTCGFSSFAVDAIQNGSTGLIIAPGNYSVDSTRGVISYKGDDLGYNNTNWYVNYTFKSGGDVCTSSLVLVTQFGSYPALIGLVGTIVFLALIVGTLIIGFALYQGRTGA